MTPENYAVMVAYRSLPGLTLTQAKELQAMTRWNVIVDKTERLVKWYGYRDTTQLAKDLIVNAPDGSDGLITQPLLQSNRGPKPDPTSLNQSQPWVSMAMSRGYWYKLFGHGRTIPHLLTKLPKIAKTDHKWGLKLYNLLLPLATQHNLEFNRLWERVCEVLRDEAHETAEPVPGLACIGEDLAKGKGEGE
jgi:hypothetical protein